MCSLAQVCLSAVVCWLVEPYWLQQEPLDLDYCFVWARAKVLQWEAMVQGAYWSQLALKRGKNLATQVRLSAQVY